MANQEHLDILKQGVEVWNRWKQKHLDIAPDFIGSSLYDTNFNGANFQSASFNNANLGRTSFNNANLTNADFSGANLSHANLMGADLSDANFIDADLSGANLSHANLMGADLSGANLSGANFTDANLSRAEIGWTIFGKVDLSTVKGLNTVKHIGPSTIGIDTIYDSQGNIPEVFLQGAGIDNIFIAYIRSLVNNPIDYYTCFISYSSKDQAFAERLHVDLQSKGVRCWFAPEDLKVGDKFWHRIDESIRLYDKLLVVLSEHSVTSAWVENEVMAALEKEHQQQKLVLFPIKLDEAIMQTSLPWTANIRRTRHIGDFTNWKHHDDYQKGLSRLLRDLKAST